MSRKPRILYVGEATFLATGYSVYGMEVLSRLHATGKYELAELACYAKNDDPRAKQLPWKFYGNEPHERDHLFNSKKTNEFGSFSFEQVCLQFRPDVVFDVRDHWMLEFEERSPFRPYYKWVIMPTVDASPQHEQWLATFMNADAVFSYSDWGAKVLKEEGGGLIKCHGSASPGADLATFTPMDKKALRQKFRFDDDVQIIGTVMRNQGRKLYPELIEAFCGFLKAAPPEMAQKTYLYLHTSYPDQGWDIPRLIKKYGVGCRTLVTYKCQRCQVAFPSFFMDVSAPCQKCGLPTARMPNVQEGVNRETLSRTINFFDVYVQYANSEGFGMPMVEAASCGVPVFATDYSAMSDVVRKVNGYPIRVSAYRMDNDFGCMRAIPDNKDLIDKWIKFFSLSESERHRKSQQARQGVEKHYTWEQTAKKWETVFDKLTSETYSTSPITNIPSRSMGTAQNPSLLKGVAAEGKSGPKTPWELEKPLERSESSVVSRWDSPPTIHHPATLPTEPFANNEEMVRWAISNVLGRPELTNTYLSVRLIRDLNWGLSARSLAGGNYHNELSVITKRSDLQKFGPEDMIRELTLMCEERNKWEQRRWQMVQGI